VGAIFVLHHVRPRRDAEFQPNHHLEVAPEFLRSMLAHLRSQGIDIITMDEVHQRLIERNFSRRFACFTVDDGYRDNRDFALPVMREFEAPFTVYVASDCAQGIGGLWWIALEMALAKASSIEAGIGDVATRLDTRTPAAKQAAFDRLHDWLRGLPGEHDIHREIAALCAPHGVDETAICRGALHVLGRAEAARRTRLDGWPHVSIFTYSKSPGLLSMPTLGGEIHEANSPISVTGVISEAMKSPSSDEGSHSLFRLFQVASSISTPSGVA
jgi:peptidoglycan/xylan/chitin deacetylase (PgdA/CDA1 family)